MADAPIEEQPTEDQNNQSQGSEFHLPSFLNQILDMVIKNGDAKRRYYQEKTLYFKKENELLQYEIDQINENDGPVFIDHGEEKK